MSNGALISPPLSISNVELHNKALGDICAKTQSGRRRFGTALTNSPRLLHSRAKQQHPKQQPTLPTPSAPRMRRMQASVVNHERCASDARIVRYVTIVQAGPKLQKTWTRKIRYSEFWNVHDKMQRYWRPALHNLAPFPPKTPRAPNSTEQLNRRCQALHQYLSGLLRARENGLLDPLGAQLLHDFLRGATKEGMIADDGGGEVNAVDTRLLDVLGRGSRDSQYSCDSLSYSISPGTDEDEAYARTERPSTKGSTTTPNAGAHDEFKGKGQVGPFLCPVADVDGIPAEAATGHSAHRSEGSTPHDMLANTVVEPLQPTRRRSRIRAMHKRRLRARLLEQSDTPSPRTRPGGEGKSAFFFPSTFVPV